MYSIYQWPRRALLYILLETTNNIEMPTVVLRCQLKELFSAGTTYRADMAKQNQRVLHPCSLFTT